MPLHVLDKCIGDRLVGRKYYCFFCGCLGIWTDETVASFDFEQVTSSLCINSSASRASDNHDIYRSLLYINIRVRSIV